MIRYRHAIQISALILFYLVGCSNAAGRDLIWGIDITHTATGGPPANQQVYAEDSQSVLVSGTYDYTGSVDYSFGRVGGVGELIISLRGSMLSVSYDLSHTLSASNFDGLNVNTINAYVHVTPYAPIGDDISISVSSGLDVSGFVPDRGRPATGLIGDVDLTGTSATSPFFNSVFVDGVEYGQVFENWNMGYTDFHVERTLVYSNSIGAQSATANGIITVEANNLSVPEPISSLPICAIAISLTLSRRRKQL